MTLNSMNNNTFYNRLWEESPMGRIGCGSPIVAAIIITLILVFSSCATKTKIEYVDRDVVKYETKIQHDTLINNIRYSKKEIRYMIQSMSKKPNIVTVWWLESTLVIVIPYKQLSRKVLKKNK